MHMWTGSRSATNSTGSEVRPGRTCSNRSDVVGVTAALDQTTPAIKGLGYTIVEVENLVL
jgi:hypothetical protein